IILLIPLFIYYIYMKNLAYVDHELSLKKKAQLIIKSMDDFNSGDKPFHYPRFQQVESGLYDENFKPIFTLITNNTLGNYKIGYQEINAKGYLIIKLPVEIYFGADYLIIKHDASYAVLYKNIFMILFSIALVVFGLSLYFLDRFAKPFRKINERLDRFLKDSIHEINTPLSIIHNNIDLYETKFPSNKYFFRIRAASKVLSNIYNDMDYLVKYKHVNYEIQEINFTKFMYERIDYFSEVISLHNLHTKIQLEEGVLLYMNEKELRRVVDNTLSNAIKYSKENTIITITLQRDGDGALLNIQDQGIGIKNVDKILMRYYRENDEYGGFGIGLNIVASIVKKYAIELNISSVYKQGTTFSYRFPSTIIQKKL
ncbi:MAG: HAMP domain-containing histidine kinase, partial [Epsilonproteobacteria bacterium]|nr:HAMP domain-containing histidine kinase [Campylobacterota bacterium]